MTRTTSAPITSLGDIRKAAISGKVVLAGGTFDVFHPGHIEHLREASEQGDFLIVHISGDDRVREKKGIGRPILPERARAELVAAVRFVDHVFIYNGRHYDPEVLDVVRPAVFYMNKEGSQDSLEKIEESLKEFGGKIFMSDLPKVASSSEIIRKIQGLDK